MTVFIEAGPDHVPDLLGILWHHLEHTTAPCTLTRQTVTSAATTNFIWDGQDVLLETDVSNNTKVTYTPIPNMYGGR